MNELLGALCNQFEEELERQENVLAVCIAQGQAARLHDLEYLEAKTAALNVLIRETAEAERTRMALVEQVVSACALPPGRQTLTELIAVSSEPWKSRLQHFQTRMRATLSETARVVRENNDLIRRSLNVVNQALQSLGQCIPAAPNAYDVRGGEVSGHHSGPAFMDQRG